MKSYLRYEPSRTFGVISSPQCNAAVYDWSGNLAVCGALQDVLVWNLRQSSQITTLSCDNQNYPYHEIGNVTTLARSPDRVTIASGYLTGEVMLFNYMNKTTTATLRGHKTAVVSMSYDQSGTLLASGGADSDIYIWDTVSLCGKARLKGHKDAVTGVVFVEPPNTSSPSSSSGPQYLVSASKDTLLKVWDLSTHHCVQTIVGHRCEIWCLAACFSPLSGEERSMVITTGSSDDLLRGYKVKEGSATARSGSGSGLVVEMEGEGEGEGGGEGDEGVLEYLGCVQLQGGERCSAMAFSQDGSVLVALAGSSSRSLEMFRLRDAQGVKKKVKRRLKRLREKTGGEVTASGGHEDGGEAEECVLGDLLESRGVLKSTHKVKSLSFSPCVSKEGTHRLLAATASNTLEVFRVSGRDEAQEDSSGSAFGKLSVLEMHGHRSDVRALCISHDGSLIASCSAEGSKIWSSQTLTCLRSCATGYGTAIAFVTGGRYLVVGTKEGALQLVDSASGEVTMELEAHDGAVWSLAMQPGQGKGFMTGGADKLVKFWDFSVQNGSLGISLTRQLQMTHDILSVRYSPLAKGRSEDRLLVAVGLLDHTVKVFYEDSLKFFLSLYGHKLPVMCMDISYDCNILVSGSADKTVKIWGLDFGDCHRSLIAHEDSVTSVRFQPRTHYFFSAGKDGAVKYWDADRFEQILFLPGHTSAVWGLDVSSDASICVSAGQDRSLRVWKRGEDLVFIEEEKERALEAQAESSLEKRTQHDTLHSQGSDAVAVASLPSLESLKSGERIMEAMELVEAELVKVDRQGEAESPSTLLRGMHPLQYMCWTLKVGVKSADLEMALLSLPFHLVPRLLHLLLMVARSFGTETEVTARCAVFLLRCHQVRIVSSGDMVTESDIFPALPLSHLLGKLQEVLRESLAAYRGILGTNAAALKHSLRVIEGKRGAFHIDEDDVGAAAPAAVSGGSKKRKKAKKSKAVAGI